VSREVVNVGPLARNDSTTTSTNNSAKKEAMAGDTSMDVVVSMFGAMKDKAGAEEGEAIGERRERLYI
jgi:hypothetical protein